MIVDTRGTQAPCTAALGEIAQGGGCRHISDMHVGAASLQRSMQWSRDNYCVF